MATFKEYINVEQADYANIPTERIDLRKFTEAPLSAAPTISNTIKPNFTGNSFGNSFINKKYLVVSFALSRDDKETLALKYNTPRLYLSVRGLDYSGASKVINIYSNKDNDGDGFALRWDGNFAIGRAKIKTQDVRSLNEIIEIGICIVRESSTDEMVGRHFVFGSNNEHDPNFVVNSYQWFDHTKVKDKGGLASINKYASDFSLTTFNETIKISPQSIVPTIQIKGTYSQRRSYKNTKYYKDEIFFEQIQHTLFGVVDKASALIIDDKNLLYLSSEDGFYINPNHLSNSVYYVYGGYQYKIKIQNTLEPIGNFNDIEDENNNWKTKFFNFFSYTGDRYRTKFVEFYYKETVKLNTTKVQGVLDLIQDSDCPYTINEQVFPLSIVSKPALVEVSYNQSGGPLSNLSYYYTKTITLINLFTLKEEEVGINIPLEDEYQYYLLGEEIELAKKDNSGSVHGLLGHSEFVWYEDTNLNVNIDNAYLYNVVNNNFIKIVNDENEIWTRYESRVPLDNPPKETHIFTEEELLDNDKTLFQYWFWQHKLGEEDITEKVKRLERFSYYTVIKCLDNSSTRSGLFKDDKVIYSDGKISYEFIAPIGDENNEFSHLDFLRYAIDKNKSIRLSQRHTLRREKLEIYGVKDKVVTGLIGYLQSNYSKYRELLQYFYTNVKQQLALSELTLNENTSKNLEGINGIQLEYSLDQFTIFSLQVDLETVNGIRPLGLRKNGIIINPLTPTEELGGEGRVFGKINARVEPIAQYEKDKWYHGRATLLDMQVFDTSGNPVINKNGTEARNWIYYEQYGDGNGAWYFDDVNVGHLYSATLGDQEGSLKKNVEKNTSDLQELSKTLSGIQFEVLSDQRACTNIGSTVTSQWTNDDFSIPFTNELIGQADFILPTYFVVWSDQSEGSYEDFCKDVPYPTISSITSEDNKYTINFYNRFYSRTKNGKYSNYTVYAKILLIKFPQ